MNELEAECAVLRAEIARLAVERQAIIDRAHATSASNEISRLKRRRIDAHLALCAETEAAVQARFDAIVGRYTTRESRRAYFSALTAALLRAAARAPSANTHMANEGNVGAPLFLAPSAKAATSAEFYTPEKGDDDDAADRDQFRTRLLQKILDEFEDEQPLGTLIELHTPHEDDCWHTFALVVVVA